MAEAPISDHRARVDASLERATQALLGAQHEEGWWVGEDEANCTLDSEYIFFFHYTGLIERPVYREKMRKLANRIRNQQRPDGTWAIYWEGPGEISVSVESYFALKLAGDSPDAPHMERARAWIRAQGGPLKARVLTRIQLALLGQMDWRACPALPIQLMFGPKFSRFNIYEISYWARACTVPLSILCDTRKVLKTPVGIDELFPENSVPVDLAARERADLFSWKNFFIQSDRFIKWADKRKLLPFKDEALRRAEKWILRHQDPSGDWGGIFPAIVNSLMALFVRGRSIDDPVMKRGLEALERFEIRDSAHSVGASTPAGANTADEIHIQPCVSPVWDTAWSVLALSEANVPHDHPAINNATAWLASKQIRKRGDWRHKCPGLKPGGWAFQFYNDRYPDTDDSSVVLMALLNSEDRSPARKDVFDRGLAWVLGLQNADGGWGAFERDVDDDIYNEILYNDEKNMLDPSTADVTGRILECLGYCGIGPDDPIITRALAFVRREQEADGKWWGRWGTNYVYGTWSVLRGLAAIGLGPDDPMVARGAAWLESVQHEDGGWGESCLSYRPGAEKTPYRSTASQTAWGVLGLIAAGRVNGAVKRGVEWLLANQRGGSESLNANLWFERDFTGVGFPNAFYLRYHYYAVYFPILALGAYRNAISRHGR